MQILKRTVFIIIFFQVESNVLVMGETGWIIKCYGITKDPNTNNFMMVMELKNGSLRQHLNNNFNSFNWYHKLLHLQCHSATITPSRGQATRPCWRMPL